MEHTSCKKARLSEEDKPFAVNDKMKSVIKKSDDIPKGLNALREQPGLVEECKIALICRK